jgi:nanoRNase/pAp phosphatase (c-di-AMP/oligoRNAs hydrolase)
MQVVTSHSNTDFDALASMVAASFLYPEALRVLPTQVTPPVREFLSVHWDLLKLKARKGLDLSAVSKLIVTDTSNWERLDDMHELSGRKDLHSIVWDHHMSPGNIEASELYREEVGAAVTLLLEVMKARDCAFSPVHATLFLLGIYEDTGSLTFPSTTARDARMAAFMLENGADLHVVSAYLDSSLDARHIDLFTRMLDSSGIITRGGLNLGICVQSAEKGLNMLPSVVNKYKDIKGLDAAFGIFPMSAHKTVVIGRGKAREFDVGAVMRQLGGGGHPGAGSAIVKSSVEELHARVLQILENTQSNEATVRSLMSPVTDCISPKDSLRQAALLMEENERKVLMIVAENNRLLGTLGANQLSKIRSEKQWEQPVKSMMRQQVLQIHPEQSLREALQLMSQSESGFLPVVEGDELIGQITRATIILNMYEF